VVRLSIPTALAVAGALALSASSPAFADSNDSANWAGYAAHGGGARFSRVIGSWRQPRATCKRGRQTYSAVWVGLGGYSQDALEQIGTELDCTASGKLKSKAWYELVPAASQPISMPVHPGDTIGASVTVVGHRVTVALYDTTDHRSFQKTLTAPIVDVTSAEWIVEAPSYCINAGLSCQTLPLANFHSVTFGYAAATSMGGHFGAVSDPSWKTTKIRLLPGGRRWVVYHGRGLAAGAAAPSALKSHGTSFKVTYSQVVLQGNPFLAARQAAFQDGDLVHPRAAG
jgi:hypothetical protein